MLCARNNCSESILTNYGRGRFWWHLLGKLDDGLAKAHILDARINVGIVWIIKEDFLLLLSLPRAEVRVENEEAGQRQAAFLTHDERHTDHGSGMRMRRMLANVISKTVVCLDEWLWVQPEAQDSAQERRREQNKLANQLTEL